MTVICDNCGKEVDENAEETIELPFAGDLRYYCCQGCLDEANLE
jgi:hypothetical protein